GLDCRTFGEFRTQRRCHVFGSRDKTAKDNWLKAVSYEGLYDLDRFREFVVLGSCELLGLIGHGQQLTAFRRIDLLFRFTVTAWRYVSGFGRVLVNRIEDRPSSNVIRLFNSFRVKHGSSASQGRCGGCRATRD